MKKILALSSLYGWLSTLTCFAYGALLASLGGNLHDNDQGVSYHILQSQALLNGTLALGNSLSELQPGLAWYNGEVQQVWGLGVGIWITPFQAIWRVCGGEFFPERVPLAMAFALLGGYASTTARRLARHRMPTFGIGLVGIILFSGPLWTLAHASQSVFEETALYGVLVSLGILVSLVRCALIGENIDFWVCCLLGAFSGLVRPTVAIYGACGIALCLTIQYLRQRKVLQLILGICLGVAGLASVALTNNHRFGSPLEFGHRLTVSSEGMVYITRFGNPYGEAGTVTAAMELFAELFLSPRIGIEDSFGTNLFYEQAPQLRWRQFTMTTFGFSDLLIGIGSIGAFGLWFINRQREKSETRFGFNLAIFLWSIISFGTLFAFYLHYPSIMSRYLVDFLPAMTGFAVFAWAVLSPRFGRAAVVVLAIWSIYGIAAGKVAVPSSVAQARTPDESASEARPIDSYNGLYTISKNPKLTYLPFNGQGWDEETGIADDVVTLMVDKPQFVELYVSERFSPDGQTIGHDTFKAMVDGRSLHLQLLEPENGGFRVIFDIPDAIQRQKKDQILFLCFSDGYQLNDRQSKRFLYSIRWR